MSRYLVTQSRALSRHRLTSCPRPDSAAQPGRPPAEEKPCSCARSCSDNVPVQPRNPAFSAIRERNLTISCGQSPTAGDRKNLHNAHFARLIVCDILPTVTNAGAQALGGNLNTDVNKRHGSCCVRRYTSHVEGDAASYVGRLPIYRPT